MFAFLLLLNAVVHLSCAGLPLPSYIKPCQLSEPDFDACALQRAKEAIPNFINGDRKYQVPNLNPLIIPEIQVAEGTNSMNLKQLYVHGLRDTVVEKTHYDFAGQKMALQFMVPNLNILAQYEVNGKIMTLPITGHGDINITLANCRIAFESSYVIEEKAGEQHLALKESKTKVEPSRAYIHLSNLFNGDKLLGDEMNRFIDENWKQVFNDVAPAVVEAINKLNVDIINKISAAVPYKDVFPQ